VGGMIGNSSPPPRRDTIDILREAIRYTESAMIRATKVTRDLPANRPGSYSIVMPREERVTKGK
jgi:hypothetical protein